MQEGLRARWSTKAPEPKRLHLEDCPSTGHRRRREAVEPAVFLGAPALLLLF